MALTNEDKKWIEKIISVTEYNLGKKIDNVDKKVDELRKEVHEINKDRVSDDNTIAAGSFDLEQRVLKLQDKIAQELPAHAT